MGKDGSDGVAVERQAALYASLVEDAFEFIVAIDADLVVRFASRPVTGLLGRTPEEVVGTVVTDHIHHEDLERAFLHLGSWEEGAPAGSTSFRLRHARGDWLVFDMTAARVSDGVDPYLAVYCRPADYQHATDEVLERLLNGADRAEALTPVLDVFSWKLNDSHIAIAWFEEGVGHRYVSTGLPRELVGASEHPGRAWETARATGRAVRGVDHEGLEPHLSELAEATGRGGYWITPVPDLGSGRPALVTVWVRASGGQPDGHAYGMAVARRYVEVILRWSSQASLLNAAARRDPLTRLANRTVLFEALDAGMAGGALLFCDLDHFKPVNDAQGHAAGDRVLRTIAERFARCVRSSDLVARVGGDEFVVAAPGTTVEQAGALAERIRASVTSPIALGPGEPDVVVGLTIGIAHEPGRLTEATLARADAALLAAKASARGTIAWAP